MIIDDESFKEKEKKLIRCVRASEESKLMIDENNQAQKENKLKEVEETIEELLEIDKTVNASERQEVTSMTKQILEADKINSKLLEQEEARDEDDGDISV